MSRHTICDGCRAFIDGRRIAVVGKRRLSANSADMLDFHLCDGCIEVAAVALRDRQAVVGAKQAASPAESPAEPRNALAAASAVQEARQALYGALSANFEIDGEGYDHAARAVVRVLRDHYRLRGWLR